MGDLGLLLSRSLSKVVKTDIEPLVNISVNDAELAAQLLRGDLLLERLGFGGSTVLVGTTDEKSVVITSLSITGVGIGGKDGTDNVSEMGNIVDVRKSGGNENIPLTRDRETV